MITWLRDAEHDDLLLISGPNLEYITQFVVVPIPGVSNIDKTRVLNDALE